MTQPAGPAPTAGLVPLSELHGTRADLLVIGGGITGTGVARDAAMRGLSVVLVEAHDLAFGTSSRSSRLIHGGIRYLEHGQLGLVFEALAERAVLRRLAPHLVQPLPFLFPVYEGDRIPLWKLRLGMLLYDLLARAPRAMRHRILDRAATLAAEPALRERGLVGAGRYFDAQCDDARLTVATARSAIRHGARVATYAEVTGFVLEGGRVAGVRVADRLEGGTATIAATVVLGAVGPWTDRLRRLADPSAAPLLRTTRGVHVVVPRRRVGHHEAIALTSPIDGRVMFVLPWGEQTYIGTTDTDSAEAPEAVSATSDDILYLLRSANALFPAARLGPEDVLATWAGLRPLVAAPGTTAQVPREHVIVEEPNGLIVMAGGKLTTYRRMAADLVDRAVRRLPAARRAGLRRAATEAEPLPGGEAAVLASTLARADALGLAPATADHLARHYGTETDAVLNLVEREPALRAPLHPDHPAVRAEVVHLARRELVRRLDDLLVRRLHLYYETPDRGAAAAAAAAAGLAPELGWDEARVAREVDAYLALAAAEPALSCR